MKHIYTYICIHIYKYTHMYDAIISAADRFVEYNDVLTLLMTFIHTQFMYLMYLPADDLCVCVNMNVYIYITSLSIFMFSNLFCERVK